MADILTTVRDVMERWNIPEWVWKPIAWQESRLNPAAEAITAREHSIGLFQINVKAHPEYAGIDLKDPRINAEIAARHFIAPAWEKVKTWSDPGHQALFVWQTGIRPSSEAILTKGTELMEMAREIAPPLQKPEEPTRVPTQEQTWWQRLWGSYVERIQKIDEEKGITWESPPAAQEPSLAWYERLLAGGLTGVIWVVLLAVGLLSAWLVFRPEGAPTLPQVKTSRDIMGR